MPLKVLHIKDLCTGCGACVAVCPKKALTLSYDEEGFYFPHLDEDKCVKCQLCEKTCQAIQNKTPSEPSCNYKAYMLKAKDKDIVKKSSSGGAFTLLADSVLQQGGLVFGARYDYGKELLEQCSTDNCTLAELRKSKYIESYTGDTFNEVIYALKTGRKVLYCGTPCQIEGLHCFMQTKKVDTSNLLTVRFVCHGVPSNKFFTEYKHYEEKKHHSKMIHFDFRPKTRGWRSADWLMSFENGKTESISAYYSYYYTYFEHNYILRRSCYSCKRVFHEMADLTIADFWAIHKYRPNNNDQEGISLCLVHTEKGEEALVDVINNCHSEIIPNEVIDNIYREARQRGGEVKYRGDEIKSVLKTDYMTVARKRLRKTILMNKTKDYISKLIRPLMIWRKRK